MEPEKINVVSDTGVNTDEKVASGKVADDGRQNKYKRTRKSKIKANGVTSGGEKSGEVQEGQKVERAKKSAKFAGNVETEMLNTLVNNLYDIQKVRISIENRNRALQEKSKEAIFNDHATRMKKLERDTVKEIGNEISRFKISEWMLGQRGIGPSLSGQTIAIIRDIERFANVSKLWAYSGMATMEICLKCGKRVLRSPKREEWIVRVGKRLEEQHNKKKIRETAEAELIGIDAAHSGIFEEDEQETSFTTKAKKMLCACQDPATKIVAQRRIKGSIIDYNPKMKKLCRNMALSLIQYNEFYGDLYNQYLEQYMQRDNLLDNINTAKYKEAVLEKIRTSKATKMARRKMVKIFLSHLWVTWRKMEGLTVTRPYIFDIGGHSNYISPPEASALKDDRSEELESVMVSEEDSEISTTDLDDKK